MHLAAFRSLVHRLAEEIPAEYMDGIAAVDVSPRAVPHPVTPGVFTLGECIPVHEEGHDVTSRVVLYHGSFAALAGASDDFDWREETWETLLHEVRHHLEWRASTGSLEAYDWAAEQNFARRDGQPFDPLFFQAGERLAEGVYRVDDDVFLDRPVRTPPRDAAFTWRGRRYTVDPEVSTLPCFVTVQGTVDPPVGDLVLVLRRKPRLRDLVRRPPAPTSVTAEAHGDA